MELAHILHAQNLGEPNRGTHEYGIVERGINKYQTNEVSKTRYHIAIMLLRTMLSLVGLSLDKLATKEFDA